MNHSHPHINCISRHSVLKPLVNSWHHTETCLKLSRIKWRSFENAINIDSVCFSWSFFRFSIVQSLRNEFFPRLQKRTVWFIMGTVYVVAFHSTSSHVSTTTFCKYKLFIVMKETERQLIPAASSSNNRNSRFSSTLSAAECQHKEIDKLWQIFSSSLSYECENINFNYSKRTLPS